MKSNRVATALCAGLVAGTLATLGCDGSTQSNVNVGTTEVKGSVGGVILDAAPGLKPLAGVKVTVIAGATSQTATTNEQGVFSVTGVPVGTVVIRLEADKHLTVTLNRTLDGAAGNFPLSNPALTLGPIGMIPGGGSFKVRLLDENGGAAAGIPLVLRTAVAYLDLASGAATNVGFVSVTATSAGDGLVTFMDLPDYNGVGPILNDALTISVPPVQIQGAGEAYAFLGGDFSYNGRKVPGQTPNLVLAGPHSAVQVVTSTLDYLLTNSTGSNPTLVNPAGPISVVFNQAINPNSVRAILYSETGALSLVTPVARVSANVLTLDFGGKMLDPATRYNLELHAASLSNQAKEYNVLAPVFTKVDGNAMVTALLAFDPKNGNDATVTFSEPVGVGVGSKDSIKCVVFYATDLDGSGNTGPGEWTDSGTNFLKCAPNDGIHKSFELAPDEQGFATPAGGTAITGFSRRWNLTIRPVTSVCFNGNVCCPKMGVPIHFQFSRNPDANAIIRRLNGSPLADMAGPQLALPADVCP